MNQLEIDMLPVGNGEKSGDAIVLRFGDFSNAARTYIVVIDGGTLESGDALCDHIEKYYGTTYVDLAICTHPDGDHASGLRRVMERMTVGRLWMHRPWNHSERIKDLFKDGRITDSSLSETIKHNYSFAYELEQLAIKGDIPIDEPFAGLTFNDGIIKILGPTEEYYESLLPDFARTPEAKESVLEKAYSGLRGAVNWIAETLHLETLDESGETSAENNSSAVTLLEFDGTKSLFTGDIGIPAMKHVISYCDENGIDISRVEFKQAPHHGSQRNVSPSILNAVRSDTVFISASKDAPKHPSRKVTNAYKRRGAKVFSTEGISIVHRRNVPTRANYGPIDEIPFYDQVQE